MKELRIVKALEVLENANALDPLIAKVRGGVMRVIQPQPVRDALHGVPIGHAFHPLAILLPAGAWVSTAVLDVVPGTTRAARTLVGFGVLSAVPASAAGLTDWSELHPQQKRVGIVHAAANAVAIVLYGASWMQRKRGKHTSGKVLAYAGLAVVSGSGFLGGHLSYRQAAGANHVEHVPHVFPPGWHPLASLENLPDRELTRVDVAGQPLLVLRRGESVDVLSNVGSHLGGPLDEGRLTDVDTDTPLVTDPWHGSVYDMTTGEVVHGPATAPQPRFSTRVVHGEVEVRLPNAG
ncbi:Rieske (2Fe-2S) protein [Marisediminicola sp. LYQ85]|uniref:Rieske (2Fe-2S) protein n=1 Tax=Marisediminicola sp. LYQ85 TaxID=3391062 RepID=UPI003983D74A